MTVLFRVLLSTSKRFFFFIILFVIIVILYLMHQMGVSNTAKMHIMPFYNKTFHVANEGALLFNQYQVTRNSLSQLRDELDGNEILAESGKITTTPDDKNAAIFYIDPPDKPIKPPEEKHFLVSKHLQEGFPQTVNVKQRDTALDIGEDDLQDQNIHVDLAGKEYSNNDSLSEIAGGYLAGNVTPTGKKKEGFYHVKAADIPESFQKEFKSGQPSVQSQKSHKDNVHVKQSNKNMNELAKELHHMAEGFPEGIQKGLKSKAPGQDIPRNFGVKHAETSAIPLDNIVEDEHVDKEKLRKAFHSLRTEQESLIEEWQKLREEQHRLLEDKIRFKKGLSLGHWHIHEPVDLFYRSRLPPTNPEYWLGLNSSTVELRYPGILFSRDYKPQPFVNPSDRLAAGMRAQAADIRNMTDGEAEDRFYQLLTQTHLDCGDIKRFGNTGDGGWDICLVDPYFPKPGCIVYSFGINYDFTFDDSVAETFGCEVRAFDPSMLIGDHMHQPTVYFYQLGLGEKTTVNDRGWKLETMRSIMIKLNHLNKTIDIVKIDIEFSEWACLHRMIEDGVLRNIKQLLVEIHTPEVYTVGRPSNKDDFYMMYSVLYGLEKHGLRKFHFTYNPLGKYRSVRTGKTRSCCYELYFVNIRFLKT